MKMLVPVFVALLSSACASGPGGQAGGVYWATLHFQPDNKNAGAFVGKVVSVDGKRVDPAQQEFRVAPGVRWIGYACPRTITVDGPAKLRGEFEAGRHYDLVCTGADGSLSARQ